MVVFSVQRSLLLNRSPVLRFDVAEEVVSCWPLCDPKCVVFPVDPPQLYPTTPFSVKGDWVESLRGGSFGVISDCFFLRDRVVRDRPPPNPPIYVSFGGSNPPFVKPVRLEVPTVLSPLCQGVYGEILVLM